MKDNNIKMMATDRYMDDIRSFLKALKPGWRWLHSLLDGRGREGSPDTNKEDSKQNTGVHELYYEFPQVHTRDRRGLS